MRLAFFALILMSEMLSAVQALHAQYGAAVAPPRTLAIGGSEVADARDARALTPALRPDSLSLLTVDFAPVPTGLDGSWSGGVSGLYALDAVNRLGISFSRYQYQSIYYADNLGAQYSHTFSVDSGRRAAGGIRLRYSELGFGDRYLPATDLTFDLGVSFDLLPSLALGFAVTHLESLSNNQGEYESRTELFGLSYKATDIFRVNAEVEASADFSPIFHFGAEYQFDRFVAVRAGLQTVTGSNAAMTSTSPLISGGLGVHYDDLQLDFALVQHADIGTTLSFGVSYVP